MTVLTDSVKMLGTWTGHGWGTYNRRVQVHSEEFTKGEKGDKPGRSGDGSPSEVQGETLKTLENTNGAMTKMHPCPPSLWLRRVRPSLIL